MRADRVLLSFIVKCVRGQEARILEQCLKHAALPGKMTRSDKHFAPLSLLPCFVTPG